MPNAFEVEAPVRQELILDRNLPMNKEDRRKKVLFVCTANACRSPMAEAIARRHASDVIEAFSAALEPIGYIPWLTKLTLLRNGCWVEGLESKGISPEVWEPADIIINMSGRTRELAFPEYSKVEDWEIEDPFGASAMVYQRVFEEIRLHIEQLAQQCRGDGAARTIERRASARLCPTSPMFISLNGANDAVVLNISENGLALSTAMSLPNRPLPNMRIQFRESPHSLEVRCRIAWKGKSNKAEVVGIQFAGLTEEKRKQIRDWLSTQTSASNFQEQTDGTRENQKLPLETPNASKPAIEIPESSIFSGAIPQQEPNSLSPRVPGTSLPSADPPVTGHSTYPRDRTQPDKKVFPLTWIPALGRVNPHVSRQRWVTIAVLGVLTGVSLLGVRWVRLPQEARSGKIMALKRGTEALSEAVKSTVSPPVTKAPGVPDSPIEKAQAQASNVQETSPRNFHAASNAANKTLLRTIAKASRYPAENTIKLRESTAEQMRVAANSNIRPVEKTEQQAAPIQPSTAPQLETKAPPPANPVPTPSNEVRPAEPEIKASTAPAGKPPAEKPAVASAKITGAVAIVADPYPSLRIADGSSKKQRQGASLELGRLVSRVEPVYPEEAKQQGIQGTVKLHAIIDKHGSVEKLETVNGPPTLVAAAMNAVRQWRYSETRLAGKSVETEEDIAVIFQLSSSGPPRK